MSSYADFWVVTGDALDFAMETCGVEDRGGTTRAALMDAYLSLEAYPEVAATLAELQAAGVTTAIMSNGSRPMIEAAVTSAGLTGLLDSLISVDDAKVLPPRPPSFADRLADADRGFRVACPRQPRGLDHTLTTH